MQNQVFVQVVTTYWTKASRGAPFSAARNLSPDAFVISDEEVDQLLVVERFSHVMLHEREGFKARRTVETFPSLNRWRWRAVSIKFLNNEGVVVRYRHRPWQGAPNRSHQPAVNRLELGEHSGTHVCWQAAGAFASSACRSGCAVAPARRCGLWRFSNDLRV